MNECAIANLQALIDALQTPGSQLETDWTNRRLTVLGPKETHATKRMSDGRLMTWYPILAEFRG
jgi:hypothetical protein